ncbi:hypothetical protein F53441_10624 [Fusarium austroafricanum]|uniref:Uncharacterized protein n=1 Tax=Fusarium austroafricanum TaxID=2364996 RepID=A0A8H4K6M9_9HYPO|nr:hypothetical protein F53441_10624 [Fusarium austroafricanum]
MASDLMGKLKETLAGTNTESQHTESHQPESHNQQNDQREFGSTNNQTRQTEGVRTGDRIDSLVENVPGVPSTRSKTSEAPSYQRDMHKSPGAAVDASRAPPSALKQHLGEPSIEHDYPHESSTKRHSSVSHQEDHYNLN